MTYFPHEELDIVEAEREQWDDGNNVLAVSPGVVVAYERNEDTNAKLRAAGIDVRPISGLEAITTMHPALSSRKHAGMARQ